MQQFLLYLQEAVEACHIEYVAQKARREVEAKAREETKKQRITQEKKKKLEYIQQLQDKMIAEDTEKSQVMGSKCKEVTSRDEEGYQLSKKAKEKYHSVATVKMERSNLYERYICTEQDCLVHCSR